MKTDEEIGICGMCNSIVNETDIPNHECVQSYPSVYTDKDKYFYPQCEDGSYLKRKNAINKSLIIKTFNFVEDGSYLKRKCSDEDQADIHIIKLGNNENVHPINERFNGGIEEFLIKEVKTRPPLYDYRLPSIQRTRTITKQLWQETSEALNGVLSAEEAAKRWKSLKDTFCKFLADERKPQPGGSTRVPRKRKWRYYDQMDFLREFYVPKSTQSNIENSQDEDEQETTSNNDAITSTAESSNKKRKHTDELPLEKIAEAINYPIQQMVLPPAPQNDELDGFCIMVKHKLQKLTIKKKNSIMFNIHRLLYEAENGE